jgi:hypothetical protein
MVRIETLDEFRYRKLLMACRTRWGGEIVVSGKQFSRKANLSFLAGGIPS